MYHVCTVFCAANADEVVVWFQLPRYENTSKWDKFKNAQLFGKCLQIKRESIICRSCSRQAPKPILWTVDIRLWGPVLVKTILLILTNTELIELFVQLFLWCRINNYIHSSNYFYLFDILFFTSLSLELILPVSFFVIPFFNYFFLHARISQQIPYLIAGWVESHSPWE